MFEKVMVPLDFSEHATLALGHAGLFARVFGSELELVHVVEQIVHSHPSFWSTEPALADELHSQSLGTAQELLAALALAHQAELGARVQQRVISGSVPGALADHAAEAKVDLMLISTHGRTGFARWLMGSVSERLLRVAPCSVLVVRGTTPSPDHAAPPVIGSILVAVDLSEHSRRALVVAAQLALAFGATLEALHVWAAPHGDAGASRAGLLERMRESARAELDAFIAAAAPVDGVTLTRTLVSGSPTAAIGEHAAERRPDLLVVGTHGHGGVKRMVLGSVAESVARYSSSATLVVR